MNSEPKNNEDLRSRFNKACAFFTSIAAESQTLDLLEFYALYKQSVAGPCKTTRPGFFDLKGKQKWDAWKALNSISKDQAMELYIAKLTELSPCWEVDAAHMTLAWASVSRMLPEKDVDEKDKTLFHFVQENNLDRVKEFNSAGLCVKDENKMTALHWACDRGYLEIIHFLISNNLDVNNQDIDGQTPLHYAASCGHDSAVRLLLDIGARKDIKDCDGCLPSDVAENSEIKELLQS